MLGNIVDSRKNKYRANCINVVIEPSCHDNSCKNADQYPWYNDVLVEEKYEISLAQAVEWANTFPAPMTLYLYDKEVDPMGPTED